MNKMLKVMLAIILALGSVMAGCSTPTPRQGNGEELSTYQLEVSLLGEKTEFFVDSQGRLKSKVEVSSADGKIILSMDKDTTLLDKEGQPLQLIRAVINSSPPTPPEDTCIVGSAYNLLPQGATFNPWLRLTLSYEPDKLPEGVREDDLYIGYYDGSEWYKLRYKKVDTEAHSVTTQVHHLTSFVILAATEPAPPSPPTPVQGTRVGNLAPDFQLPQLDGQTVSLSNFQGKPVLINFWSLRCPPCLAEIPFIQEIFEDEEWSDKGLVILAINLGENPSTIKSFMESYGFSFPVLIDTTGDVARKYGIRAIPTTFLIGKDGIIKAIKVGAFSSEADIEKNLSKIIP